MSITETLDERATSIDKKKVHAVRSYPMEDEYLARLRDEVAANRPIGTTHTARLLDEIDRLKIELKDWQDSSEAYRADAEKAQAALHREMK